MDELLNKNIFKDAELLKYAPDYNCEDIYLRLEHRRDMAKDTQKHRQKINQTKIKLQRKIYNNSYYKVNTELAKLHSLFRNKDADNQLILKNCKKRKKCNVRVKADAQNSHKNTSKSEVYSLQKEMCAYVQNSQEFPNLTVENESYFKILPKVTATEISHNEPYNNGTDIARDPFDANEKNNYSNIDKTKECVLTSCDNDFQTKCTLNEQNKIETFDKVYLEEFTKDTDLQSLLIMMTVTSNYSEPNDEIHSHDSDAYRDLKENTVHPNSNNIQESAEDIILEKNSIGDILKIKPLIENREIVLCKKYLRKWKEYVKMKAENMINRHRKQTLNMFLGKISKAKHNIRTETAEPTHLYKAKVQLRDYNSYQHRYKVQKNIIALQKAKLEQQNKLIEELKYNKIIEASKHSIDTMKEEVRKTYYEIDKHLKPKIKLLTNELNIKEIEEPSLVLHCLKVPQFLQRMEARARKREEKHAIIRERRKQIEEEKIRLKQQAELEKVEMDREEKLKRMKELKEKRKKEKIENIRKKQHAERLRALTVMADLHYEKSLMLKYGLRPFQLLIQIKKENVEKARAHYKFQIKKNIFLNWMFYTEDMWFERNYLADAFYRKTILTRTWNALKENHYKYILKKQVAEDYYDLYVTQLTFRMFRQYVKITKEEFSMKWTKAVNYHNCNLLFKTFTCWRTLPALNALQREQEARKLKWRQKVLQVVPDYKPPDD